MEDLHDRVVRAIKGNLNNKTYDVYINPGQEKNAGIGDNYPDVIMTDKGKNSVRFILEVEVASSVTQDEAEKQWKKYATEISATLYLVVPENSLEKAKKLCQNNNINARFATYTISGDNFNFKFD